MYITSYLVLTLLGLCSVVETQNSVQFLYKNKVYTTYSSWLMTFTYELAPYENHVNLIRTEIIEFHQAIVDLVIQGEDTVEVYIKFVYLKVLKVRGSCISTFKYKSKCLF